LVGFFEVIMIYWIISVVGLAVVAGAPYLTGSVQAYAGFLPWIRTGVEGASWTTVGGLALVGFLTGIVRPKRPWRLGYSTVMLLPIWATIEMILDPTSHNLWPLEFGVYAFWGLMASLGAQVGGLVRNRR
jgi:hypothetical protein